MSARKASVSHDGIQYIYGTETFTLRQYSEIYKHALPGFITVRQGYFGVNEMEVLGNEQTLRIASCVHQKRAVAVDSNKRTLSIPTNYPLMFRIVQANNKVAKDEDSLCNILVKKALPVKVQISDSKKISFSLNNSQQNVHTLGVLTIQEVYEETYFLANSINSDGCPNPTALLIPLYLGDILIAVITGIEGKSQSEWKDYQVSVGQECKRLMIPMDTGLNEIALYSPHSIKGSDNIYDYIEPSSYIVAEWEGKEEISGAHTITKTPLKRPPKPAKPPKPLPVSKGKEEGPPTLPDRNAKPQPPPSTGAARPKNQYVNTIQSVKPIQQLPKDAAALAVERMKRRESQEDEVFSGNVYEPVQGQKPVSGLSIDELATRLKDLKLDKYVKTFKEQGVDGELATEMNENILQDDFKFSKFESLKFMKFVRTGHIPK